MALWFEREEKSEWIKNVCELNGLTLLYGILGTGKSSLVRRYSLENHLKTKLYSFTRSLDMATVLGVQRSESLEDALRAIKSSWENFDLIVWDDFHHIKIEDRHALIQFVKSQVNSKHIFISEENLQEELGYDIPALHIEPFSIEEVEAFVAILPEQLKAVFSGRQLFLKTGGLPLLLQLSFQQKSYFSDHKIWLKQLNRVEQDIIWYSALQPEGIEEKSNLVSPNVFDIWNDLVRKNILDKRDRRYFLTSSLQILLENEVANSSAKEAAQKIISSSIVSSPLTHFKLCLIANDITFSSILEIQPDDMESLSMQAIQFYEKLIANFLKSKEVNSIESGKLYRLKRLYLNCLILSSKRTEALNLISIESEADLFDQMTIEKEWYIYESIYWMMRSGRYEEAAQLTSRFVNRASSPVKEFVTIELAIPHVQSEPDRAIQVLERGLRQIRNIGDVRLKILCEAQARYQMAIALSAKKMYAEGRNEFRQARSLYLQINKPYFALFSLLNSTWTNYYNGSWSDFVVGVLDLKKSAEKFGFEYLIVCADLLFSLLLFETGKDSEAFIQIDKAIARAKKIKHMTILGNCLLTKIKFEFERTNYENVTELISEIKEFGLESPEMNLKLFEKCELLTLSDLLDVYSDLDSISDPFLCRIILLCGHYPKNWKSRTSRDFLVEDELRLRKSKSENDFGQFLVDLKIIANRVRQLSQADEVNFAVELSALEYAEDQSELHEKIEILSKRLQLSSLSLAVKKAFMIWLEDVRNKRVSQLSERWNWWRFGELQKGSEYLITTLQGKSTAQEKPLYQNQGVFVDETLGEVYFSGQKIAELGNKPVLRQILIFLCENYPQPCGKASFAIRVWGESYSPLVHDPRIYTSIQRIRKLIKNDCIQSKEGAYFWNQQYPFTLIRAQKQEYRIEDRTQSFIFEALLRRAKMNDPWMKKSEIAEGAGVTDSTLKRALSFLIDQGKIERTGAGPAVKYRKKIS